MVRQVRAQQTRSCLIDAAAAHFASHGYTGATVARISMTAGVTPGALTFHFLTKEDLAHAVTHAGAAAARSALEQVQQITTPGLAAVTRLTQVLALFLEEDVHARAAARLAHECPEERATWEDAWPPALSHALDRARAGGASDADLCDIELLAAYLLAGAEARMRAGWPAAAIEHELGRLWRCAAAGLGADTPAGPTPCGPGPAEPGTE